jgi:hypothetical protein
MRRPKIRNLPQAEKEKRYAQHLVSLKNTSRPSSAGAPLATTKVAVRRNQLVRQPNNFMFTPDKELDACLVKFSIAMINPFDELAKGACLPSFPAFPSQKMRTFVRITSKIGLQGVGYVLARGSASNNSSCCSYTDGAFNNSTAADFLSLGTGIVIVSSNSNFATADFGTDGVQQRLVALGLRVRYTGTELNRSGRISMCEHPNHDTWVGTVMDDFRLYDNATSADFDRSWHTCTYQPISAAEFAYGDGNYPPVSDQNHFIVIQFSGVDGEGYEFEMVQHHELIGSKARSKTPNSASTSITENIISKLGSWSSYAVNKAINAAGDNPNAAYQLVKTLLFTTPSPQSLTYAAANTLVRR